MKKITLFILVCVSCSQKKDANIDLVCRLPKKLHEVSGIQPGVNGDSFYLIQDSGNGSLLYEVTKQGKKKRVLAVDAKNIDWEDLATDNEGHLYLGDFGNNDNTRKDLCIYKINPSVAENATIVPEYRISFYYPEQAEFPPSKKELLYDCEAFFEHKGFFYLFTKNRSKGFDGTTLIYQVPNRAGNHAAILLGKYNTGKDYNTSAITSAAISPDGSRFVLLSHDKIYLFEDFKGDDFLNGKISKLQLNHYSQKEAVCFNGNTTLLIADERDKSTGGNVYGMRIGALKSEP